MDFLILSVLTQPSEITKNPPVHERSKLKTLTRTSSWVLNRFYEKITALKGDWSANLSLMMPWGHQFENML